MRAYWRSYSNYDIWEIETEGWRAGFRACWTDPVEGNIDAWLSGGIFGGGDYPWWKYFRLPEPKYEEFKYLRDNLENAQAVSMIDFAGGVSCKKGNNSIEALCQGVTYDFT